MKRSIAHIIHDRAFAVHTKLGYVHTKIDCMYQLKNCYIFTNVSTLISFRNITLYLLLKWLYIF